MMVKTTLAKPLQAVMQEDDRGIQSKLNQIIDYQIVCEQGGVLGEKNIKLVLPGMRLYLRDNRPAKKG